MCVLRCKQQLTKKKKNIKLLNFMIWITDFERDSLAPFRQFLYTLVYKYFFFQLTTSKTCENLCIATICKLKNK